MQPVSTQVHIYAAIKIALLEVQDLHLFDTENISYYNVLVLKLKFSNRFSNSKYSKRS